MKNSNKSIVNLGRKVIKTEALALNELADRLNGNFDQAVDVLFKVKRKVIVTGVGKSGLIGQKIAATLTSTGTPAFFLHPTDALHGDLGLVRKGDAAIIISKSGETDELYELLSVLKRVGVKIIALLGKLDSPLAGLSDVVLDVSVKEEACPHDLVPTSSTTAALAMGANPRGHASWGTATLRTASALRARLEFGLPVMAMILAPRFLRLGIRRASSAVSPL